MGEILSTISYMLSIKKGDYINLEATLIFITNNGR